MRAVSVWCLVMAVAFLCSGCGGGDDARGAGGAGGAGNADAAVDAGGMSGGTGGAGGSSEGCGTDIECEGDRICVDGECVDPPGSAGSGGVAGQGETGGTGGMDSGAGGAGGSGPGDGGPDGGGSGGGGGGDGGSGGTSDAGLEPIAIYIMLDVSGSMQIPPKWTDAVSGITDFVEDPDSANLDVALQYFPINSECTSAQYEIPAVPMGRLPKHAANITESLDNTLALGDATPIEPALQGATDFCAAFEQDPVNNPEGRECVVVFITDGEPTQCSEDPAVIAGIAGRAYNTPPGVTTFAVGMFGADFFLMYEIAEAGGGDCRPETPSVEPCDLTAGMTLLEALETIRGSI